METGYIFYDPATGSILGTIHANCDNDARLLANDFPRISINQIDFDGLKYDPKTKKLTKKEDNGLEGLEQFYKTCVSQPPVVYYGSPDGGNFIPQTQPYSAAVIPTAKEIADEVEKRILTKENIRDAINHLVVTKLDAIVRGQLKWAVEFDQKIDDVIKNQVACMDQSVKIKLSINDVSDKIDWSLVKTFEALARFIPATKQSIWSWLKKK